MKGFTKEQLECSLPRCSAADAIDFCLEKLYADKHHNVYDVLTQSHNGDNLTYEELIGALLLAKNATMYKGD